MGSKELSSSKRLLKEDEYVERQFRLLQSKLSKLRWHVEKNPEAIKKDKSVNREIKLVADHILKEIENPHPIEAVKQKQSEGIETDLDRIVDIVASREKISLSKISRELNVPMNIIEKWAKILDKHGTVKLVYPKFPLLPPYLKIGGNYERGDT